MKTGLLISILFLTSVLSFGQKKMMEKAEKAFKYYENGEKYKAVKIFEELIIEYPKSEYYGRNLYNIPTIYQELDSTELAISGFKKVLEDKKLEDSEKDFSRGIFETNTNFKHYSAMNIGIINYNLGNYREALKYYQFADTQYPYYNSSGTDIKMNKIKLASNISDCYINLGQVDSAIVFLLPHALTISPKMTNYASEKVLQILEDNKKKIEFKNEFDKSLENIVTKEDNIELTVYKIKIWIKPYIDEKLTVDYIKQTDFYKKLNEI